MNTAIPEQIIVFSLDSDLFAIDVTDVQEILPTMPCRSLPDTAAHVQGLMTFRGQVIPLLNLGILLNLGPSRADGNTIIIAQGSQHLGLMVDAVDEVVSAFNCKREPLAAGLPVQTTLVHGIVAREDKAVVVLNAAEILSNLEV